MLDYLRRRILGPGLACDVVFDRTPEPEPGLVRVTLGGVPGDVRRCPDCGRYWVRDTERWRRENRRERRARQRARELI